MADTKDEIPRRCRIDRMTAAELAITEAMRTVEVLPPDVLLTHAVTLLSQARDAVADYADTHCSRCTLPIEPNRTTYCEACDKYLASISGGPRKP